MANIMSMIKLKNNTHRNGFDLSKKNAFTAKVGELLPVYCKEVLPGDKFTISPKWLTRTRPVNTAAYTRIREYYDFFFVPTNLLWKNFNVFVTNMLEQTYSANNPSTTSVIHDKQPFFTVNQIVSYLTKSMGDNDQNFFGYSRAELTCKLLHYLGYGDFSTVLNPLSPDFSLPRVNAQLNPFPLLAYQKACDDHFRNSQWQSARPNIYNVDYLNAFDMEIPVDELSINNSSVSNMFDLQYANWNKDYFMGLLPNSQYGNAATVDVSSITLDDLNIVNTLVANPNDGTSNINDMWHPYLQGFSNPTDREVPLVVLPGQNLPKVYSDGADDGKAFNYALKINNTRQSYINAFNTHFRINSSASGSISGQQTFSVLALRQAEAKQKWAEITQSNVQDYRSQVQAHFGKNVSEALSMRSTYIGGCNSTIDISEVVNTNLESENSVSQIHGKGVGVGQGSFDYECPVHGYIIGIYHAVPLLDYSMTGIKRQNLKTTFMDYAIPEFDQTGMVKVPTIELTNSKISTDIDIDEYQLGYAPRYIDYKTDIDEVHGAFFNGGFAHWVAPFDDSYIKTFLESYNIFNGLNWMFMKVNPAIVNPIFDAKADSTTETDQLLVNCYFDVKAVRNLDVNGLPY